MKQSRRDFLGNAALIGAGILVGGCVGGGLHVSREGAAMSGFRTPPMKKVRVGMIAVGARGKAALDRLMKIPGIEITAICEIDQEKIDRAQKALVDTGKPKAREYFGAEAYKLLCDDGVADVFYNCTPRDLHTPFNVYAMNAGLHVLTEVPSGRTVEECWETVETCEKNRVHCMMLENCCYGEYEMLALNLARSGVLGELVQCDGAYIHDQRHLQFDLPGDVIGWRIHDMMEKYGNFYPTHGLGPLCKCLDINRGDRFDYLVSMNSATPSFEGYARTMKKGTALEHLKFTRGDVNFTLIRTVKGRLISLQHNIATPRPYSRINQLVGTKGTMRGINEKDFRVCFEKDLGDNRAHQYLEGAAAEEIRVKYRHPLWQQAGDLAKKVGGHGGMDFLMDVRWAYCLQNGLPLDTDVYDLATWSSIIDLTSRSVRGGSVPVTCPDFTRGAWKTAKPVAIEGVDLTKMGLA